MLLFGPPSYSVCVAQTKTIIHLKVDESVGYLSPLRWIIVNEGLFQKNMSQILQGLDGVECSIDDF